MGTSPAAYPVRRGSSEKDQVNWHLVGGLPYGTPGSASGLGERVSSNPGTAPQADSTSAHHRANRKDG